MQKNIQSVITGNTFTTSPIKGTDTGITALYCRLSQDDGNVGDSDSIINQKNKELAKKKRLLADKEKRYVQLDGLFQRIYEDNVSGKLSDERFVKMSQGYETEQKELQSEMESLR